MKTQLFGRISPAIVSTFVILASMIASANASATNSILLAFSSNRCGHCQAMQPTLQKLESSGTPIRHVNVDLEPELAQRHGIRQTPSFIVLSSGRELTRLVGAQSIDQLLAALAIDPSGPQLFTGANLDPRSQLNAPETRLVHQSLSTAPQIHGTVTQDTITQETVSEAMPNLSVADAVQRAQAATVRLRVHDGNGYGVGTGTIIDRHGEEALVLTCGHLFRETKLQAKIDVDLFVAGQVQTVSGTVIDYDADHRDIALVVIRPGFDIQPVVVLNPSSLPQSGQSVFSFGCDHGADPSRRDTRITAVNKYNQHVSASNLEIAGAPVDGRSGGGLFDQSGRLVGVCNAADYQDDIGIYTGPGSVQWQLDRVQLAHLYQTEQSQAALGRFDQTAPQTRLASMGARAIDVSVNQASHQAAVAEELIVIIRDPNEPAGQRVINVRQPTPELMEMIHRHAR